jgi:hypothetical protein
VYLVLGAPPPEAICIVCGSGGGLQPGTAQRIHQGSVGTKPEGGDLFGASLSLGDMDGDGQQDLFIGSPGEDGAAGPDTGLASIRYGIDVGTFELRPADSKVLAGGRAALELTWTHPERWRDLESVHLRLVGEEEAPFWVRFDAVDRLLTLVDAGKARKSGVPGSHGFLRSDSVALDLRNSELVTSGPEGRDVTLRLALRFHRHAPQGTFAVEVLATDVHGNSQGFESAGTLEIRPKK